MQKTFDAILEEIPHMMGFVRGHAQNLGFSEERILKIELACEEAFVNIIKYAYPNSLSSNSKDQTNPNALFKKIHIECVPLENPLGVSFLIKDQGIPFDPLANKKIPDLSSTTPIQDRKIGGYGIYFYTSLMDKVLYRREAEINILTLIKYS